MCSIRRVALEFASTPTSTPATQSRRSTIRSSPNSFVRVATGPEALRRMQVALESFIIEGITTTIPFLARVMANKHFQEGAVDTKFLERESQLMKEPLSAA